MTCFISAVARIFLISVGSTFLMLLSLEPLISQLCITSHMAMWFLNSIYFFSSIVSAPVHPTDTQAASKNGSACVRNRNCFPLMQRTAECRGSVCGCFHHRQARRSGLCVRIPYCYLLYLQQLFQLINTF